MPPQGARVLNDLGRSLRSKSWLVDGPLIVLAWWAAFWLRFNLSLPQPYFDQALRTTPVALACMAAGLLLLRWVLARATPASCATACTKSGVK